MLYSNETIDMLSSVFNRMIKFPNTIEDELFNLKSILEKYITPDKGVSTIKTSKPNNPFFAIVIPDKYLVPFNNASVDCDTYNVDIDISMILNPTLYNINGEMYATWLLHEIFHNVLTTTTIMRMKMLILENVSHDMIKYYQREIMKPVGTYLWLDIFSRTVKDFIKPYYCTWAANTTLVDMELTDTWNAAFAIYVKYNGGNPANCSLQQMEREDRISLMTTNGLMREHNANGREFVYTADRKRKFDALRRYVIKLIGSSLFVSAFDYDYKNLFNNNEDKASVIKEKYINSKINDNQILRENASEFGEEGTDYSIMDEGIVFNSGIDYTKLLKRLDTIRFEMEDVQDIDSKIVLMYKLRDIQFKLTKYLEDKKHQNDSAVIKMLADAEELLESLRKIEPSRNKKSWGVWISQDAVPEGYEG